MTFVYSDEAIEEINKTLKSKKFYVGSNGKLNYSVNTDTIKFVLQNMTGP